MGALSCRRGRMSGCCKIAMANQRSMHGAQPWPRKFASVRAFEHSRYAAAAYSHSSRISKGYHLRTRNKFEWKKLQRSANSRLDQSRRDSETIIVSALPASTETVTVASHFVDVIDSGIAATTMHVSYAKDVSQAFNEVAGIAEGEDFWTNVLRYITFFITIVSGFITFAVR